jgi:Tfp pilus assembly protein PilN
MPFVPLVAGLGGLAVIISLGFLLQIGLLDRKIEAANRTLKELDPTYIPASAKKALEDQVNARWNLMDRFAQKEPYWEDLFVELSHAVHEHVQLTAMEYKEGLFTLQGIYNQKSDEGEGTIPTLLRNLSQGLFTDAKLSSTKAIPNKEGYFGFTVTCKPVR